MRYLALLAAALAGCSGGASGPPASPVGPAMVDAAPPALAAEPAPDRVVHDLLANRLMASTHLGSNLLLEAGRPDFWKYIDGGWKSNWYLGERDGERAVALVQGVAGVVRLPLDHDGDGSVGSEPGDRRLTFTARPAVPKQTLSLFWDEKPLGNLALDEGWKSYEVTVPAERAGPGEHAVRFHFRAAGTINGKHTAAAIERILIGPKSPAAALAARDPAPTSPPGAPYSVGGATRPALAAAGPARFSYYLRLPPQVKLVFHHGTAGAAAGVSFAVRAASEGPPGGHKVEELWSAPAGPGWRPAVVDLAALAGRTVRLDLVVRGGGGGFASPRLVADGKPPARPKVKVAEHVIVWLVDTLRADRLSALAPKTRVKTPGFDQLAREGVVFSQATVQGNYSLPSHTSLLSGVIPAVHKMFEDKDRLAEALPIASQIFQRAGFATAIFSSNGYISDKWGFKKGWEGYRNFIREDKPNSAAEVWKAARPWLDGEAKAGKRTFMYLATVDPHVAYNPPPQFLKPYWPRPYSGPIRPIMTSEQLFQIKVGKLKPSDNDKRYLEALYDAEVAQNDTSFVQLLADLKQMGLYDKTAIVLVSDHGDEFFDHGSVGHGHSVYEELVHVPLIVRWPPLLPPGKQVRDDVELTDVYATLFDLAGLDPNHEAQGESVVRLALDDGPRMDRTAEASHGRAIRSLRSGPWKLITWGGGRVALYDLAADPGEKQDLAAVRPIALRRMRNLFACQHAFGARWHKTRWGVPSDIKPAFVDEVY